MAAGFPSEPWLRLCSAIEGNAKAAKGGWQWTTSPRPGDLVLFTVAARPTTSASSRRSAAAPS